jgi:hypothetical protein
MKSNSRTTRAARAKPNGKAKKPANRATDRAALTRARALIAERPTMKPKTALRKAGVTSEKKITLLSEVLSERRAAPLLAKSSAANVRRERKPAPPSSVSQSAEPAQHGGMHSVDHHLSKRLQTAMNRVASMSIPPETQAGPNAGTDNGTRAGTPPSLWSKMFRWSPYGIILWQMAVMTDVLSRTAKSPTLNGHRQ